MTAPAVDTRPFAPFEWLLAMRYLRARRKEGFISVIAGFSFAGILLGVATAAGFGLLFGIIAIRRQGIYFAMVTLALSQMVFFLALQLKFTGGEDGIQAVPRGHLFGIFDLGNNLTMYYFVLAVFLAGFALIHRTIHSPFGQVLKAIRENEPRAVSLGAVYAALARLESKGSWRPRWGPQRQSVAVKPSACTASLRSGCAQPASCTASARRSGRP